MGAIIELDASHQVSPAMFDYATPDYFRAMGTPILDGREFNAGDGPGSERVAIVNQEFAAKLGIGPHLVGKRVSIRFAPPRTYTDRKSTRLNSSHRCISYAVFCLK